MKKKEIRIGDIIDIPKELSPALESFNKDSTTNLIAAETFMRMYKEVNIDLWAIIREHMPETKEFNLKLTGNEKKGFKLIIKSLI